MPYGAIISFRGKYGFLSNFYLAEIHMSGIKYPSVEHAYQAAKTEDDTLRQEIADARTPGSAKRLGRRLKLRPRWDDIKEAIMRELLTQKFSKPELAEKLLATDPAVLVESNHWHDRWWGVCHCQNCDGYGRNILGRMLMTIRKLEFDKARVATYG